MRLFVEIGVSPLKSCGKISPRNEGPLFETFGNDGNKKIDFIFIKEIKIG